LGAPYVVEFEIAKDDFLAAGEGSGSVKDTLKMLGIPSAVIRRAAIITYEAEMNLVIHGGGGVLKILISPEKVEIVARDDGPGIPDVELAMREGFSTAPDRIREMGFGAGMGLPNIKRNADSLEIESAVGVGTTLTASIDLSGEGGPA